MSHNAPGDCAISLPFLLITLLGYHLLLAIDKVAQFHLLDGAAPLLMLVCCGCAGRHAFWTESRSFFLILSLRV